MRSERVNTRGERMVISERVGMITERDMIPVRDMISERGNLTRPQ